MSTGGGPAGGRITGGGGPVGFDFDSGGGGVPLGNSLTGGTVESFRVGCFFDGTGGGAGSVFTAVGLVDGGDRGPSFE